MKTENAKVQMRKGLLEYCILLVLKNKPLYISHIIENLEELKMAGVEGTLYSKLIQLKNEGYLQYYWEEVLQGPPRKYYELTEPGKLFLHELGKVWHELTDAVHRIGNLN